QEVIPRTVLVEHLKILFAFHLALYHLQMMVSLPARLAGARAEDGSRHGLFVDVAGIPDMACAQLAERSAHRWYGRISAFVQATFTIKKLDDFAQHLLNLGRLRRGSDGLITVDQLLALNGPSYRTERDRFADSRLPRVLEALQGPDGDLDPQTRDLVELGLDPF